MNPSVGERGLRWSCQELAEARPVEGHGHQRLEMLGEGGWARLEDSRELLSVVSRGRGMLPSAF